MEHFAGGKDRLRASPFAVDIGGDIENMCHLQ
jgi:hypothetical protein